MQRVAIYRLISYLSLIKMENRTIYCIKAAGNVREQHTAKSSSPSWTNSIIVLPYEGNPGIPMSLILR